MLSDYFARFKKKTTYLLLIVPENKTIFLLVNKMLLDLRFFYLFLDYKQDKYSK